MKRPKLLDTTYRMDSLERWKKLSKVKDWDQSPYPGIVELIEYIEKLEEHMGEIIGAADEALSKIESIEKYKKERSIVSAFLDEYAEEREDLYDY